MKRQQKKRGELYLALGIGFAVVMCVGALSSCEGIMNTAGEPAALGIKDARGFYKTAETQAEALAIAYDVLGFKNDAQGRAASPSSGGVKFGQEEFRTIVLKDTGDIVKTFFQKDFVNLLSSGSNFDPGVFQAIGAGLGFAGLAFDILKLFQEKAKDPVMEKLKAISNQISAMDAKIDFKTDELQNSVERTEYNTFLNEYSKQHETFLNEQILTKTNPMYAQLRSIFTECGYGEETSFADEAATTAVALKVGQSTDLRAKWNVYENRIEAVFRNDPGDKDSGYKYFSAYMNLLSSIIGDSHPFCGKMKTSNAVSVIESLSSVIYDWQHESWEFRSAFLETLEKSLIEYELPLYQAMDFALLKNKLLMDQAQAVLEKDPGNAAVKDVYEAALECFELTGSMRESVVAQIAKASVILKDGIDKLKAEKAAYEYTGQNYDTAKAYNYRVKAYFYRDPFKSGYGNITLFLNFNKDNSDGVSLAFPADTLTAEDAGIMNEAASQRGTNLTAELKNVIYGRKLTDPRAVEIAKSSVGLKNNPEYFIIGVPEVKQTQEGGACWAGKGKMTWWYTRYIGFHYANDGLNWFSKNDHWALYYTDWYLYWVNTQTKQYKGDVNTALLTYAK